MMILELRTVLKELLSPHTIILVTNMIPVAQSLSEVSWPWFKPPSIAVN